MLRHRISKLYLKQAIIHTTLLNYEIIVKLLSNKLYCDFKKIIVLIMLYFYSVNMQQNRWC